MKTNRLYILILISCLILGAINMHAQEDKRPTSYIGLQVGGGFSNLFISNPVQYPNLSTNTMLGGGLNANLFYNLQYKHFLLHTGFGINYTFNRNQFDIENISASIVEYPTMKYHYTFNDFVGNTNYGVGYIPLMLGVNYEKWYFLAGAKFGLLSFASSSRSESDVTIWGTDEDIIDPLEGLHTHAMQTYHVEGTKTSLNFTPFNAMLSAEVGLTLNKYVWLKAKERQKYDRAQRYRNARKKKTFKQLTTYRLSLFADYGLTNIRSDYQANDAPYQASNEGGIVSLNSITDMNLHSAFGHEPYRESKINNLFVGLKLTMQVEMPKKAPKKGALATPYLYVYAKNEITDKPISGARVKVQDQTGKVRVDKYTEEKRGRVYRALVPGPYTISVSHKNYLPADTIHFEHRDDYDTVYVTLYPKHPFSWPVVDDYTNRPVKANYEMQSMNQEFYVKSTTDSVCCVSGSLDDRLSYKLNVTADGYEPFAVDMERVFDNNYVIRLKPIKLKTFVLQNIYFATGQTTILSSSEVALDMLYNLMAENPKLTIRNIGHTDDVGTDASNDILSQGRANSVKQSVVKRGIAPDRVQTIGKGEKDPIVANDSDEHRQMNRRVEIEILTGAEHINIEHLIK